MRSFRIFDRQAGRVITTIGLLIATIAPAFTPALASAATITGRSIALSSSTASATGVTYGVTFTPVATAAATAVQFCSDSPLIGASCAVPAGLSVSGVTVAGSTSVTTPTVAASMGPVVVIEKGVTAATQTTLTVVGVTNPSTVGTFYARIITYDSKADALADYTDTASLGDNDGFGSEASTGVQDTGSVALTTTDEIGVSAAVLESLTFCVGGATTDTNPNPFVAGCVSAHDPTPAPAPTLDLGETNGAVKALDAGHVSTGDIYTQLSTNAASGAIVSLKSGKTCGGLARLGAAGCDIAPQGTTGTVTLGHANFGLTVNTDSTSNTALGAVSTGTVEPATGSAYDGTNYRLNYVSGNASGVGSTYGDPILDTGAPGSETQPSNRNTKLTFGASISPTTPAGLYSNNFSLIATGKF